MATVSLVIRAYNEEKHIGRLLTGVMRQSLKPIETILVDSGSSDATVDIATRFPDVRVISIAKEEFSFGRSLNRGCHEARGDILVIASAHVYPLFDSWLEELSRPFENDRVALAYGRQVGTTHSHYSEQQIFLAWFPSQSVADQDHPFCNNANAAIRRKVWEQLPYDESLTGLEDVAWAQRAMREEYKICYSAEAVVAHAHGESWRQIANRYRREAIAHRVINQEERMSVLEAFRLGLANIGSDLYHAWRDGALGANIINIPRFRSAQFWGTYRGFAQRGPIPRTLKERFYYPKRISDRPVSDINAPGSAIHYREESPE